MNIVTSLSMDEVEKHKLPSYAMWVFVHLKECPALILRSLKSFSV